MTIFRSGIIGFVTLVLAVLAGAAQAKVVGKDVNYEVDGVKLVGYIAFDDSIEGTRPGVLVVHEWWGLNDDVRMRADMLAKLGYTAMALDMYGDGKSTTHSEDAQKFSSEVFSNMDAARKRFAAARDILSSHASTDPAKIAAIGYCFGGGVALAMARSGMDLDGVATFHGMLATKNPAQPGAVKARLLVMTGGDDPFVPPEQVEAFRSEMASAGADMKLIVYPGAVHAFTSRDADALGEANNLPLAYNEAADKASWAELQTFLGEVFK